MGKLCVICQKESGIYPLCKKHLQMKAEGSVIKCEDCGTWHLLEKPCLCKEAEKGFFGKLLSKFQVFDEEEIEQEYSNELTCIICGEVSNGKHFCYDCYKKYNNQTLTLTVKKCKTFVLNDSAYESDLYCDDGHFVKSEMERHIDDWLFNKNVKHIYEKNFQYERDKFIRPDWCLPNYMLDENGKPVDVYVEYFGIQDNPKYEAQKQFKLDIYRKNRMTLVCFSAEKDKKDINGALSFKLRRENIKLYEINE